MGAPRKMGATSVEDRSGHRTQIFYNEDTDQIVHVAIDADGRLKVSVVDIYGAAWYDYDVNKDLIYKGQNKEHDADGSESNWKITKYTYDVDVDLTKKQILEGIWNSRTGLAW